jgi:uracil-DNA glycosylase
MTDDMTLLLEAIKHEARRAEFPVDCEVYTRSGRDPNVPILFAGSLEASLCIVGRDLGKDEVRVGEPLIGAAGRSVRAGIIETWRERPEGDRPVRSAGLAHEGALAYALLTNLVPYKPIGNKAYSEEVRRRFRPFLERLLVDHWKGQRVITLGSEAFAWFRPYADPAAIEKYNPSETRFQTVFRCTLPGHHGCSTSQTKVVSVYPLPHPSPLNRRWFSRFPSMLANRLIEVWS